MSNTNRKILIIGIDGGTWDVFSPVCDRGWMPNLDRFRKEGCVGSLRSTHPPITPAAWTSFMTGQNPGHHEILGFSFYNPRTHSTGFTSSRTIKSETLWQKLARHGRRVAVINVPMTFPPMQVSGSLVTGLETPSTESEFTWPPELKQRILERVPDLTYARRYRSRQLADPAVFARYIDWLKRQADQLIEMLLLCTTDQPWDVAMVLIRSFDELLHHFWKFLDFSVGPRTDPRAACMQKYYTELDEVIGRLFDFARDNDALTLVVSDHGGQAKRGSLYPNRVLRKLGYLRTVNPARLATQHLRRKLRRSGPRDHPAAKREETKPMWSQVDWPATRAAIAEINQYASLFLQVAGLQPHGSVPPEQCDQLLDQIAADLRAATDTDGNQLFQFIERTELLYRLDPPKAHLPNLLLAPPEGYLMKDDVLGSQFIKDSNPASLDGTHSMNGMFAAMGQPFHAKRTIDAEIIDVAPTILAALDLPVTDDINGRVITEIFTAPPAVRHESRVALEHDSRYAYTSQDEQAIADRLADLGYL